MTWRSGKTLEMVKALPATGSIVVVHTLAMRMYLRNMIQDLRGEAVSKITHIVVIDSRAAAEETLVGARVPVRIDHAFEETAPFETMRTVRELARLANTRFD